MSLYLAIGLLLVLAALAIGLSQRLATRQIALLASAGFAGALLLLGLPLAAITPQTFTGFGMVEWQLVGELPLAARGASSALLAAAALASARLAATLSATVRGFGPIFGWLALVLAASLLALASEPIGMMRLLCWAVVGLSGAAALRASGVGMQASVPPQFAATVLLAVALAAGGLAQIGSLSADNLPPLDGVLWLGLGLLLLSGASPLRLGRADLAAAPAPLGLLLATIPPVLALEQVRLLLAALPIVPRSWAAILVLIGLLGAISALMAVLREQTLRGLLLRQIDLQASLALIACALVGGTGSLVAPLFIASIPLLGVAGGALIGVVEQRLGDDQIARRELPATDLRPLGLLWALLALALVGAPGWLTFWATLWFFEGLAAEHAWAVAPLIAVRLLSFVAMLFPLASLLLAPKAQASLLRRSDLLLGATPLAVLLVAGLFPNLLWPAWLAAVAFAPAELPVAPLMLVVGPATLALVAVLALALRHSLPPAPPNDPDAPPLSLGPDRLANASRPLGAATAEAFKQGVSAVGKRAAQGLQLAISLFEDRYYLFGIMFAALLILLIMAL